MDTISRPLFNYLKRNKESDSKEIFTNYFKDIFNSEQAINTLYSNMSVLKSTMNAPLESTLNQSKDNSLSLNKLQSHYKSLNDYYRNNFDVKNITELKRLITSFNKVYFPLISTQRKTLEDLITQSNDQHSKLNLLSYPNFKQESIDYYETSRAYNSQLVNQQSSIAEKRIQFMTVEDRLSITAIIRQSFKDLGLMYENYSNNLLTKLRNLTEANALTELNTKTYLNHVESYYSLLNSIYYSKEIPKEHLNKIKQLLSVYLNTDSELVSKALLNSNLLISRLNAKRVINSSIGKVIPIVRKSILLNKHMPIRQKAKNVLHDLCICLNAKLAMISDIRDNDTKMLIKHLRDFEQHLIAQSFTGKLFQLYLYGFTHQFSNNIFDHFANNTIKQN